MAANPPSKEMKRMKAETLEKINRLKHIILLMAEAPRHNAIKGLKGNRLWQKWPDYAKGELKAAFKTGTGEQVETTMTYINIQAYTDKQVPAEIQGLVSSIASQIHSMNAAYVENNRTAPAAPPKKKAPPAKKKKTQYINLYPPSKAMKEARKEDLGKIERLSNIFKAMASRQASGHKHEDIPGLKGDPCPWQVWADYMQAQIEAAYSGEETDWGSNLKMRIIYAGILAYDAQIPAEARGVALSLDSRIHNMIELHVRNSEEREMLEAPK